MNNNVSVNNPLRLGQIVVASQLYCWVNPISLQPIVSLCCNTIYRLTQIPTGHKLYKGGRNNTVYGYKDDLKTNLGMHQMIDKTWHWADYS